MISIGIRVEPQWINFAIYDKGNDEIINLERLNIPMALIFAEQMQFVRSNIIDILRIYNVSSAGIRVPEGTSFNTEGLKARLRIETILQEALSSSEIDILFIGNIASISSKIDNLERTDFKKYTSNEKAYNIKGIKCWSKLNKEKRESIFCAKGAANV